MKVRGTTPAQRAQARRERTHTRRGIYYRSLLQEAAGEPRRQLSHACDYLRAIAKDLPPAAIANIARKVAGIADDESCKAAEANRP